VEQNGRSLWGSFWRTISLPAVGAALGGIPRFLAKTPEGNIARGLTPVMLATAMIFAARFITHLELKYWIWKTGLARVMCIMMVVEGLITLAFLAAAPCLYFEVGHPSPHQLSVEEFAIAGGLLVIVFFHTLIVSWLVEQLKLDRGSEHAKSCLIVRILRGIGLRLNLKALVKRLERTTAINSLSVIALWILISLGSVALANTPAVGPAVLASFTAQSSTMTESRGVPKHQSRFLTECGPRYEESDFGRAIPQAIRAELFAQWFGRERGLGETFGGCINRAHEVGTTGVWVAAGTCDSVFRSLAVATPSGPGAILLWGPGRFALSEAENGSLVEATPHALIGSGDMYTVTTTYGTNVFIREELSNGIDGLKGVPRACDQIDEDPVQFVRVPPALTRLWLAQMELEEQWLWPAHEAGQPANRFVFRGGRRGDTRSIEAECQTQTLCVMNANGTQSTISGGGSVSVERLMEFAPTPL
jgi:hypothetical protein